MNKKERERAWAEAAIPILGGADWQFQVEHSETPDLLASNGNKLIGLELTAFVADKSLLNLEYGADIFIELAYRKCEDKQSMRGIDIRVVGLPKKPKADEFVALVIDHVRSVEVPFGEIEIDGHRIELEPSAAPDHVSIWDVDVDDSAGWSKESDAAIAAIIIDHSRDDYGLMDFPVVLIIHPGRHPSQWTGALEAYSDERELTASSIALMQTTFDTAVYLGSNGKAAVIRRQEPVYWTNFVMPDQKYWLAP